MTREKDFWRYRRLVVFALTGVGLVLPFVGGVHPDVYWPFYTLVGAAVGAYIGFATVDDRWNRDRASATRVDDPDGHRPA